MDAKGTLLRNDDDATILEPELRVPEELLLPTLVIGSRSFAQRRRCHNLDVDGGARARC